MRLFARRLLFSLVLAVVLALFRELARPVVVAPMPEHERDDLARSGDSGPP